MEDKRKIDYHTYKNKLLEIYPESIVDIQLVYEDDEFTFSKESGKVIYSHKVNSPFKKDKKAIGGYCVIKNRLGEFLEIMNETEILKCKQVAKMKNIWNNWTDEMYLKTIIKRATKRFFYDVVKEIDIQDNKDYDLSLADSDDSDFKICSEIENIKTIENLKKYYNDNKDKVKNKKTFNSKVTEKKKQLGS